MRNIHPDSTGMVENYFCHGIVRQFAQETGAQAQPRAGVGDVEFSAANIDFHGFRKFNAPMSRRGKPHHTLAQSEDIIFALGSVA
jgi:hypothetical protein